MALIPPLGLAIHPEHHQFRLTQQNEGCPTFYQLLSFSFDGDQSNVPAASGVCMHYQSWLWLSVVQENILQRSKGKGHQRQYHFTCWGGGLYAHKLGRKSEMFWLYANALLCMFEAKKRSVKTNIFCRLPSDPQIRHVQMYAVYLRELFVSLHSRFLFLPLSLF